MKGILEKRLLEGDVIIMVIVRVTLPHPLLLCPPFTRLFIDAAASSTHVAPADASIQLHRLVLACCPGTGWIAQGSCPAPVHVGAGSSRG